MNLARRKGFRSASPSMLNERLFNKGLLLLLLELRKFGEGRREGSEAEVIV